MSKMESLSVAEAARRLGLSVDSVKRLCDAGKLPCFRTGGGHRRIPAEAVEAFRRQGRGAQMDSDAGIPSPGLQSKREEVEREILEAKKASATAQKIEAQERLNQLLEARAKKEAERKAEEMRRQQEEREELERVRLEQGRQKQRAEQECGHREWKAEWLDYGFSLVPQDAPREIELHVHQNVEEALARLDPEQPHHIVERIVRAAVEKGVGPWKRERAIEGIIERAIKKLLPLLERRWVETEPCTALELRAIEAARAAIVTLREGASLPEIEAVVAKAVKQIADEHEHREALESILQWTLPVGAAPEEREASLETAKEALEKLPIGCGRREMELARDAALAPFKARVEHRQNYTTVLQGTYLWGASSELQQAAKQAVKEELEKLPPGCNRWEMEQARNRALAPFEAAIKASRTADHYLSYVDNYIEKVGDEEEGEWDLGDHWERRKYAEKLKKKLRPILIDKLFKEQLDEDDAYEFIEKWVDERLEAEEE